MDGELYHKITVSNLNHTANGANFDAIELDNFKMHSLHSAMLSVECSRKKTVGTP